MIVTRLKDLTGNKYGKLTVICRAPNQGRRTMWYCECDCGNTAVVRSENLQSGNSKSCGCIEKEHHNSIKHGMSGSRLDRIFNCMKQRYYNPNNAEYYLYGARGIDICEEWLNDRTAFFEWANKNGYRENATQAENSIDRIDTNKGYSPDNCRWADAYVQANNTRKNIYYEWNDEVHTITEWSRIVGINSGTIYKRINCLGWTLEEALTLRPSRISQRI